MMRIAAVGFAVVLAWQGPVLAAFPKPVGFVNDFARVLSSDAKNSLEQVLRDVERDTSAEVVVLTVASLDGLRVENYATQLFNRWGIGKKNADNGVLILVATRERQLRIEVGLGLERVLTNDIAARIVQESILPSLKNNDYDQGIGSGVSAVLAVLRAPAATTSPATPLPAVERPAPARAAAPPFVLPRNNVPPPAAGGSLLWMGKFALFYVGFVAGIAMLGYGFGSEKIRWMPPGLVMVVAPFFVSPVPFKYDWLLLWLFVGVSAFIAFFVAASTGDGLSVTGGLPSPDDEDDPRRIPTSWSAKQSRRRPRERGSIGRGGSSSGGGSGGFGGGGSSGGGASGRW